VHIGVFGAGQLGKMLALAGYPLGFRFTFVDPTPESPASQVALQLTAAYDDPSALERLSATDIVTYEFENIPDAAAASIAARTRLCPNSTALRISQDRLLEKSAFRQLGIATADFANVTNRDQLQVALDEIGTPSILKTRRYGYDGKGQHRLLRADAGERAFITLGQVPCVLEKWVQFTRELSLLCVRTRGGQMAFYPLVQNVHHEGILRLTLAPAPGLTTELQRLAEGYAVKLLQHLDYAGVLALELFQINGQLLANEFAPRVHNSGHFTIEGAATSQFENHLRAIADLPLGDTSIRGSVAMLNLVGNMPNAASVLAFRDVHLHDYGKIPRADRKLGHITIVASNETERSQMLTAIEPTLVDCGAMPPGVVPPDL
jgi:5-(carboxyamino)imidazole ribonucleotide synthase